MRHFLPALLMIAAQSVLGQAPADDAVQRGQRKAGTAYTDLQKAEFETKQAEQEHRQAHESLKAAQKRADELKLQAESAHKKAEAAKAREVAARKTYESAVDAVDKLKHPAAAKK
jgi:chromosome segregation ATPase